jgi:acyl carrier protein
MQPAATTVEAVIVEALVDMGVEAGRISPATSLAELDVDSLDLAELSQIISDRFAVEVTAEDAPRLRTVGDLLGLVEERR